MRNPFRHGAWLSVAGFLPVLLASSFVQAQMVTPGQFQVSESGAATYTIPIQVSPGVGGMEPKLSLNYSSQSGNGLLGMGWSLGGLGGVGRCPRTMAQDGVRGGVNYDSNDRYCLDGQRLIAINGSEGGDGTEYRTERESFARVVSYGSAGNGPAWFKVWTKAGQVMEYGKTTDARIEAQGKTTIRVWALNRIEDTKGNYLTASYTKDAANGDYYPNRIDYTGNSKTNTAPTNSVQFQYEARPDIVPMYQAGSVVKSTLRMSKVLAFNAQEIETTYNLSYSIPSINNASQLVAIKLCPTNNACLFPLALTYENGDATYGLPISNTPATSQFLSPYWKLTTGDVNGDGKTDVIALYNNSNGSGDGIRIVVMLSNGDGTYGMPISSVTPTTGYLAPYWQLTTGDVNGDGKTDVLALYNNSNGSGDGARIVAMLSNGDGTFGAPITTISALTGYLAPYWQLTTGDVNGDGKTDVLALYNNSNGSGDGARIVAMLSNGDGTFGAPITTISALTGYLAPYWKLTTGDVNGDGKTDVLALYNNSNGSGDGARIVAMLSNGDGTFGAPIT
ncbi:FG-GAP-like repeat-containing protein, partial [Herbaspirillum sp. RV1423]|uniref:FG-GAP-like repeat-containing protein n=1 Tax=Herbaspirillum sp. RV1423 TaxID=1443993 RepID=UPI0018CC0AAA